MNNCFYNLLGALQLMFVCRITLCYFHPKILKNNNYMILNTNILSSLERVGEMDDRLIENIINDLEKWRITGNITCCHAGRYDNFADTEINYNHLKHCKDHHIHFFDNKHCLNILELIIKNNEICNIYIYPTERLVDEIIIKITNDKLKLEYNYIKSVEPKELHDICTVDALYSFIVKDLETHGKSVHKFFNNFPRLCSIQSVLDSMNMHQTIDIVIDI